MSPTAARNAAARLRPQPRSRKPRRRRPSARNLAIHRAYRSGLRTQGQLAREFDLPQQYISRIVRQVDRWIAREGPHETLAPAEQAVHEWRLEIARLKAIIDTATDHLKQERREVCTIRQTRTGERLEEIRQQIGPDPRLLAVALRASEQLHRLIANPPRVACDDHFYSPQPGPLPQGEHQAVPPPSAPADGDARDSADAEFDEADIDRAMQTLYHMRRTAEEAGLVPRTNVADTITALIQALMGVDTGLLSPSGEHPSPAEPPHLAHTSTARDGKRGPF